MRNKLKRYPLLLVGLVLILATSVMACGQAPAPSPTPTVTVTVTATPLLSPTPTPITYVNYVNKEFHYSLDYPSSWVRGEINPNEMGFKPSDDKYSWIQIGAFPGPPKFAPLSTELKTRLTEIAIRQWLEAMGGKGIYIISNQEASGEWDWAISATFVYENTPLALTQFIRETPSTAYTFCLIYPYVFTFKEGWDAKESFTLTE